MFEQSGTFKNEFKKLGIEAYDYDILNDYGQTDYQIDLFSEIEKAYNGDSSVFDGITPDDVVLAFFPCTYFEVQSQLWFAGNNAAQLKWSIKDKCEYAMNRHVELNRMYVLLNKLVVACLDREIRLVIENPSNGLHYLKTYWCVKPTIVDKDRTLNGDYYKKPTQYWFINFEPQYNIIFEPIEYVETRQISTVGKGCDQNTRTEMRSEIHPQYANRFIRQFILESEV
jgi:hypothetical protein